MPLFKCEQCGCVENTALSNYWTRNLRDPSEPKPWAIRPALCSACDPDIGKWHGAFPQRPWTDADEKISGM